VHFSASLRAEALTTNLIASISEGSLDHSDDILHRGAWHSRIGRPEDKSASGSGDTRGKALVKDRNPVPFSVSECRSDAFLGRYRVLLCFGRSVVFLHQLSSLTPSYRVPFWDTIDRIFWI